MRFKLNEMLGKSILIEEEKEKIYSVELTSDMTDITFYVLSDDKEKLKAAGKEILNKLYKFIGINLDSIEADETFTEREIEFNRFLKENNFIYLCSEDNPDGLEFNDKKYYYFGKEIQPVVTEHFRF